MTEKDYCLIIGIKESEIYSLHQENTRLKQRLEANDKENDTLTKDLEAARAQLEGLARDRNDPL